MHPLVRCECITTVLNHALRISYLFCSIFVVLRLASLLANYTEQIGAEFLFLVGFKVMTALTFLSQTMTTLCIGKGACTRLFHCAVGDFLVTRCLIPGGAMGL